MSPRLDRGRVTNSEVIRIHGARATRRSRPGPHERALEDLGRTGPTSPSKKWTRASTSAPLGRASLKNMTQFR